MIDRSVPDWLPHATHYVEDWLGFQMRLTEQPGCVVAVAAQDAIICERAFGLADIDTGEVLTPRHRFRVASHSKTFTAAAIMKLRETGRVRLDDPVGRYVPTLPDAIGSATIAQLLGHSAGLMRDGVEAGHWQLRQPFFDTAALRTELVNPLTLPASERFKYSNLGYGLLGLAIETITGMRYEEWITRDVVVATGLTETVPDVPLADKVPCAKGHGTRLPLGRRPILPFDTPTHALAAATGFVSTATDLARFFARLSPHAMQSMLSPESRREMSRRHWQTPHSAQERHYGLGTMSGEIDQVAWFGHGGAFPGFITRAAVVPDWDVAISIVTNAIDGLANQWTEGAVRIMARFAKHGVPDPALAGWYGRWWSPWSTFDLVPMGDRVLVAQPTLLMPFTDASEIAVSDAAHGDIALANGYGSHGEPVRRICDAAGGPKRLWLGGAELVGEAELADELRRRAGANTVT